MTLELRPYEADHREAVLNLARTHRFPDYAGYARFGHDFASDEYAAQVGAFLDGDPKVACVATSGGDVVGFTAARPLAWETDHFGIVMAGVPYLLTAGRSAERAEIGRALMARVSADERERGTAHLTLRLDTPDLAGLWAAGQQGFQVMDTIVTYLGKSRERRPEWLAEHFPEYESSCPVGDDLASIPSEDVEHFADFMRKAYRINRFHADRRLPADRADEVYVEWFRKIFTAEWATGSHIVRRDGKIVAFCSFQKFDAIHEEYGVNVIGRGLAAVLPEARGVYSLITENAVTISPPGTEFMEFDTQIQNLPVVNVWGRSGLSLMRSRHSLHHWLDE